MPALFALLGTLAGTIQTVLMWRAVRNGVQPFRSVFRLLLVGSVLYAGAAAGHLLPGAAGWAAGFAVSATVIAMKGR